MMQYGYFIVLDFDGTVVKHRYPAVGEDVGAVPVLRKLVKNGHRLLLSTMRSSNSEGVDTLQPALDWFKERDIPLFGVNENPSQKTWTSSSKVYGNIYIDDAALGAPLKTDDSDAPPFIDWGVAAIHLFYHGCLTERDIIGLVQEGVIGKELVKVKQQIKAQFNSSVDGIGRLTIRRPCTYGMVFCERFITFAA